MYTSKFANMNSIILVQNCWVPKVLGPGGDASTSEGKGDLGAAQVEFPGGLDQHWKQMQKRALGNKWTGSSLCSTSYMCFFGSVKEV